MIICLVDLCIANIVGRKMQVVLKVHHGANRPKIAYIVDAGYKERGCYTRNINYLKFENKIIEVIKKICKIYANREMLEETYKKVNNKSIDLLSALKNEIKTTQKKVEEINRRLDQLYEDKLNGILQEADFLRISQKFVKERNEIEIKYKELTDRFQSLQGMQDTREKNDTEKMNNLINEFIQMKEIDKATLFRLIDKIEIDKDKNAFITFNFAPLNSISENLDEFIEIEKLLNNEKNVKSNVV